MDDNIENFPQEDRVNELYRYHDSLEDSDVIYLAPKPTPRGLSLIDDVTALLENPKLRRDTEEALTLVLQKLAARHL
jgi:hypothetical protein